MKIFGLNIGKRAAKENSQNDIISDTSKRLFDAKLRYGEIPESILSEAANIILQNVSFGGLTDEESAAENERDKEAFLRKDITQYINCPTNVVCEIQQFFISLNGAKDFNREFWIAEGKETDWLAQVLSVYTIFPNRKELLPLIDKANSFLKGVKKITSFLDDYPYYTIDEIKDIYSIDTESGLTNTLKKLSIAERLHFFDFLSYRIPKYWNGDTYARTRRFVIDEVKSIDKMISLGLFFRVRDIQVIPFVTSKGELKEKAEAAGFELKKSWTLDKIFHFLASKDNGKEFLNKFIEDKCVLLFNDAYSNDVSILLKHCKDIKRFVDLLAMI